MDTRCFPSERKKKEREKRMQVSESAGNVDKEASVTFTVIV